MNHPHLRCEVVTNIEEDSMKHRVIEAERQRAMCLENAIVSVKSPIFFL